MQHKPIVEKLLAHYTEVYERVQEIDSYDDIQDLLKETQTDMGICCCAGERFNTDIYRHEWVDKYGVFWGRNPAYKSKPEVLSCLKIRIDNLTTELELINKTESNE